MSRPRLLAASLVGLLILAAVPSAPARAGTPLTLDVTVSADTSPDSCGDAHSIDITAGDAVNFCYTITNAGDVPFEFHTLGDNINGILFADRPQTVPPGGSYQYNDVRVVAESQALDSTWVAATALADYEVATSTDPDPDRIFADDFDSLAPPPTYAFVDISESGTPLPLDDDGETNVDIGFDFAFYGVASDHVRVGNNGGILFGVDGGDLGYTNQPLPNAALGPAILPFWDDLTDTFGGVYAQTLGEAPNRRFVVQWNDRPHYVPGGAPTQGGTFEAILHEGSNAILFQYANVDFDGDDFDGGLSATIGLNQGSRANQYSYNTASVEAGSAILFVPVPFESDSATASVTITAGVPAITVEPASLSATLAAGATTQLPLDIGNVGTAALVWSLHEAATARPPSTFAPAWLDAAATTAYAPRQQAASLLPANKATPSGTAQVPAFGVNLNALDGNTLVKLDAAAPASVTAIAPVARTLVGGAFLDDDFSTLYSMDFNSGELVAIDTATAATDAIGVAATLNGENWSGLAVDPTDGTLYASSTLMSGSLSSTLYRLDPASGTATPIGPITGGGRVIEIAADATGTLYGVDIAADVLVTIDKATGAASAVGPLGFNSDFAQGLDFDPASGVLYFAAVDNQSIFAQPGQMYTIDTATGHATLVGGISADPASAQISAFAIAQAANPCLTPANVPWLDVGTTEGTTAPGTTTSVDIGFDAAGLAPGHYEANLCVRSNDPQQRIVRVPVDLDVQ